MGANIAKIGSIYNLRDQPTATYPQYHMICEYGTSHWVPTAPRLDPPDFVFYNGNASGKFQGQCANLDFRIGEVFATCELTQQFNGLPYETQQHAANVSDVMLYTADLVRRNVENACGSNTFWYTWPLFYQDYGTSDGKKTIDTFLANHPEVRCGEILKRASVDVDVQRNYQFMNQSAQCFRDGYYFPGTVGDPNPNNLCYPPKLGIEDCPYPKESFDVTIQHFGWQPQPDGGWHLASDPTKPGWFVDPGGVGNPYWLMPERQAAQTLAFGGVLHAKKDPITQTECDAPGYKGKLPFLSVAANQYNPIKNSPFKPGGAGKDYRDPCLQETLLEKVVPGICGFFGFYTVHTLLANPGFGALFVSGLSGASLFYLGRQLLNMAPPPNPLDPDPIIDKTYYGRLFAYFGGAALLSAGAVSAFTVGWNEKFGLDSEVEVPIVALSAAAGAVLLFPVFNDAIESGPSLLFEFLFGIVDTVTKFTKYLFNGCYSSHWWRTDADCLCSDAYKANAGKAGLIDDWLDIYYGVTGEQRMLRKQCLQSEMTRGAWASTGDDQNVISQCGGVRTNFMDNPMACFSSGAWTFGEPDMPSVQRFPALNGIMWDQIYHCLDPKNPSMLPPATDKDRECQKYGPHWRWDETSKSCRNWILPGDSRDSNGNIVESTLQFPGSGVTDPTEGGGSGCVIS